MRNSVREDLLRSLGRLSVVGTGIMSFVIALVALRYMGFNLGTSLVLSLLFSSIVTLSRIMGSDSVFVGKKP